MELNDFALLHAVAQAQNVSRAAERLLISQPAVSKQLREIERRVGVPLFDRLPRGVRPTQAGALLASYEQRLIALAEEAQRAVAELRGLERGRLSVGASTTVGVYLLPEVLVRFRLAHPGVQIHLEIAHSDDLARRLKDGTIDMALTEGFIDDNALESRVLMEDQLVAIAPAGHPLTRKRSVTAQTLCREPFVVRETSSPMQSMVERALAQRGLKVRPAMSLGSTEAIKRAVEAGVGVAIVSGLTVALEVQTKRLALIRVPDLSIRRPVYRVTHRTAHPNHSAQAFHAMLDEIVRTKRPTLQPQRGCGV